MKTAIIGGSGVYDPSMLTDVREVPVKTIFGDVLEQEGKLEGREVLFLARHGAGHTVAPHKINYRANIAALKVLGADRIIATAAVGSLSDRLIPGSFVIPDQFIDNTWGRPVQFFDEGEWAVTHIDVTEPYCPQMSDVLAACCKKKGLPYKKGGTYVCFQGPRYETAAEVRMFGMLGGDIVGMTHVPEIVLAREAEICYGGICVVTNFPAGIAKQKLTHGEVNEMMAKVNKPLKEVIADAIINMPEEHTCKCGEALDEMVSWGRRRPNFLAR
ncbi:MAG TPA: S-methyl-5'-thioinosine phosphorylase [Bacillota bacterium]|nr:S-methyl-5'-thioinosine phosphorylase [Bacillota bacterium]